MVSSKRLRIGYAFSPNKEKAVIQPSLIDYAKLHGLDLVPIDLQIPLLHQAPFHAILHKVYDHSWIHNLRQFTSINPNVPIVEPPESISPLLDRVSMLEMVKQMKIPHCNVKIEIPKQVVVEEDADMEKDGFCKFRDLGLKFPVIAKPLEVNGSAQSHELSLVFNRKGLKELTPPVVLQEFVNHGGVLFKVYVIGDEALCMKRKSLPDIWETEEELQKKNGVMKFSQISRIQKHDDQNHEHDVEMPPLEIVKEIARGLREAMGVRLFNFDLIRDKNNTYFVIDINYLPGYAVIPNYEPVLTKFFMEVVGKKVEEVPLKNQWFRIGKKEEEARFQTSKKTKNQWFGMGMEVSKAINGGLLIVLVGVVWWVFLQKLATHQRSF